VYNKELHNLYSSETIKVMKSRKMGWSGHIAQTYEKCTQNFNLKT
jgi:hypothetical protein